MNSPRIVPVALVVALTGCMRPVWVTQDPQPMPARGNSESVHALHVPPGRLPRPGECRVWLPGVPPGHQPRAGSCAEVTAAAPPGSMILYRPSRDEGVIHVHYVDQARAGVIVVVRIYAARDGALIREERPEDHHDEDDDRGRGRRRSDR